MQFRRRIVKAGDRRKTDQGSPVLVSDLLDLIREFDATEVR
jgi:hypothetical protein